MNGKQIWTCDLVYEYVFIMAFKFAFVLMKVEFIYKLDSLLDIRRYLFYIIKYFLSHSKKNKSHA